MKAVIELDVPEWQIGQDVSVYFPDSMLKKGKCELLEEHEAKAQISDAVHETAKQFRQTIVRCKDCKYGEPWGVLIGCGTKKGFGITHKPDWFCADGERK